MDIIAAVIWQHVVVEEQVQNWAAFSSSGENRVTVYFFPLREVTQKHFCSGTRVILRFSMRSFALSFTVALGVYGFFYPLEVSFI
jgi:hypothetical protein